MKANISPIITDDDFGGFIGPLQSMTEQAFYLRINIVPEFSSPPHKAHAVSPLLIQPVNTVSKIAAVHSKKY
jgi:hypothetical protein